MNAPPRVFLASRNLLLLTPIRLALGGAGLLAAVVVADTPTAGVLAAFGAGAVGAAVLLSADPRLVRKRQALPLPAHARVMSVWQSLGYGVMPSTAGVAILAAVALAINPVLAAFLAGVEAGMGATGFVAWLNLDANERREGSLLYVERGGRRSFQAPRADRPARST